MQLVTFKQLEVFRSYVLRLRSIKLLVYFILLSLFSDFPVEESLHQLIYEKNDVNMKNTSNDIILNRNGNFLWMILHNGYTKTNYKINDDFGGCQSGWKSNLLTEVTDWPKIIHRVR